LPTSLTILEQYEWPGNVRELENVIERAVILCEDDVIAPNDLPERLVKPQVNTIDLNVFNDALSLKRARNEIEELLIRRALDKTAGNKSHAAELLELSYPSLLSKIKKYGIQ